MNKHSYYFIIFLLIINLNAYLFANNWNIYLKDKSIIPCKKIDLERDSIIKFTDFFNIERTIKINFIETIMRINNRNTYDKVNTIDTFYLGNIIEYRPKNFISLTLSNDSLIFLPITEIVSFSLSYIEKTPNKSFEIGAALGYPAAFNIISGIYYKNYGLRISGSYIYLASGLEIEIKYKLFRALTYNHFLKFVLGYSEIKKDKFGSQGILRTFLWRYYGLSYEVRYKGLFFDFGLSSGEGDYKIPNLIFKFGYSYFFEI